MGNNTFTEFIDEGLTQSPIVLRLAPLVVGCGEDDSSDSASGGGSTIGAITEITGTAYFLNGVRMLRLLLGTGASQRTVNINLDAIFEEYEEPFTATEGQTIFDTIAEIKDYNLKVRINGVPISPTEYIAPNGNSVILNEAAHAGDIVIITITPINYPLVPSTGGETPVATGFPLELPTILA